MIGFVICFYNMTEDFLKVQRNIKNLILDRIKTDPTEIKLEEFVCTVNAKIHPSMKHINAYEFSALVKEYMARQLNEEFSENIIVVYMNWRIINLGYNFYISNCLIFQTNELSAYLKDVLNNSEYVQFQSRLVRPIINVA